MYKRYYKKAVDRITRYLVKKGYTVNLQSNGFAYYDEEDLITCSVNATGTYSMICGLLHEAGHALQPPSTFNELRTSSKRDRVIVAEQEYKAWEEGWKLACRLKINTDELRQYYIKAWMNYWTTYLQALYTERERTVIKDIAFPYVPESRVDE